MPFCSNLNILVKYLLQFKLSQFIRPRARLDIYFLLSFLVNIKKENYKEKNVHKIGCIKTDDCL